MSLTQVTEQAALEEEALQFLFQDEHKEKEGPKQALRVAENRGKKFHEVRSRFLRGFQKIFCIPCFLVLQDWLQCTNYQNSILFHHSLMYGF